MINPKSGTLILAVARNDARCGVCHNPLYGTYAHGKAKPLYYACQAKSCVGRRAKPLEDFVTVAVVERLVDDGELVIPGRRAKDAVDVRGLNTRREALVASKNRLGTLFARDAIDEAQLEAGSMEIRQQIADIDKQLAAAVQVSSPARDLLAEAQRGGGDLRDELYRVWERLDVDVRSRIVSELCTIRLFPSSKRGFNHEMIQRPMFRVDTD